MTPILTLDRSASQASVTTTAPTPTTERASGPVPELTSGAPDAAPSRQRQLFVVATHKVRDRSGGSPNQWLPYGTEHAWEPGTRRTLCGEWITGWTVFWDRHFSARPAAACASCVEATLPEASRRRLDHFDSHR